MASTDSSFIQNSQIVPVIVPQDMGAGAVVSDRVKLEDFDRCTFVVWKDAAASGEDPDITLLEANAATGGTTQSLVIIDTYYLKEGATAVNAVGEFTRTTQTVSQSLVNWAQGENEAIVVFDVRADQMSSGFEYLLLSMTAQSTAGAFVAAVAILWPPRLSQQIVQTAIA